MSATLAFDEMLQPRLRDDIIFGPPQKRGAVTTYLLKDRYTNWFYRVGYKEYFLLSRMDGDKPLHVLNEEYAAAFGHSLNWQSWEKLLQLLEKRQMLADGSEIARLEELKEEGVRRKKRENTGLLRRRFPLVNPDRFLAFLLLRVNFAYSRFFIIPALLCIVALEFFIFLNMRTIALDAWTGYRSPVVLLFYIGILCLCAILHEIAHGLTCKKFGGTVKEIGIVWRYLLFAPYCKIDDAMLFHNRWQRIYTSFAGIFINLLSLVPFGILWWLAPEHSVARVVSALLLLWFNANTFLNLLPFVELDGYFMLNHALSMVDLRKTSHQFWKKAILQAVFRRGEGNVGYSRRDRAIYLTYGSLSLIVTAVFLVGALLSWFTIVDRWLGPLVPWSLALAFGLVLLYKGPAGAWLKRSFSRKRA